MKPFAICKCDKGDEVRKQALDSQNHVVKNPLFRFYIHVTSQYLLEGVLWGLRWANAKRVFRGGPVVAPSRAACWGRRAGAACQQTVEDQGQGAVVQTCDLRHHQQLGLLRRRQQVENLQLWNKSQRNLFVY